MCLLSNQNFRRFVAVLLLICLICAFMMISVERASALDLVLTPAVIAVVGSALVACGFTFANSGEMSAVVQKCWNAIPTTVKSAFVELASSFSQVQADSPVGFITYKLSKAMVSSLSEWFASDVDSTGSVAVDYGGFPSSLTVSASDWQYLNSKSTHDEVISTGILVGSIAGYPLRLAAYVWTGSSTYNRAYICLTSDYFYENYSNILSGNSDYFSNPAREAMVKGAWLISNYGFKYSLAYVFGDSFSTSISFDPFTSYADGLTSYGQIDVRGEEKWGPYMINGCSIPVYKYIYTNGVNTSGTSADVPCDLVYGPNSTADTKANEKTDVVVSGSLLNNGSLSDTAVGSMTTTGVRDVTGAETSAQTGLLSGLLDLLKEILAAITSGFSSVLDWLKSMLQSLTDAISGVASAVVEGVKAIFIPSDFAWTDFINQVQALAPTSNVDFREYSNEIEIPDITMTSKWGTQTIVDNSAIRNNIGTIRKYLGAFLTALLIIFNANMVMKFLGMASFSNNDSRVPFAPSYPNSGGGSQQALPAPNRKGGN